MLLAGLISHTMQLVKTDSIQGFQFGNQKRTGDQCQATRSIAHSKLDFDFESRCSNAKSS